MHALRFHMTRVSGAVTGCSAVAEVLEGAAAAERAAGKALWRPLSTGEPGNLGHEVLQLVAEERVVVTKDGDLVDSMIVQGVPYKLLLVSTGNISRGLSDAAEPCTRRGSATRDALAAGRALAIVP